MDMNEVYRCHHIGICTSSPRELINFYTEKLGFREGETKHLSRDLMEEIFGIPFPASLTKLEYGQAVLELISPEGLEIGERDFNISGYNHWGFAVEDKVEFCRKLREQGVEVIKVESKGRPIFFIKDPEGNLIEIYEVS